MVKMAVCKHLFKLLVTVLQVQLFLWEIEAQSPGFTFQVQLHSYSNPSHRREDGDCCDGPGRGDCDNECDTLIQLCLGPAGGSSLTSKSCPLGLLNVDAAVYSDQHPDDFDLVDPETLSFQLEQEWPGGFQLRIDINDEDGRNDDLVDTLFIEVGEFAPSATFTSRSSHKGSFNRSTIDLSFRLTCNENFYGPTCASFCMPTDDGHFTCDADGNTVACAPAGCENPCDPQYLCQNRGECITQDRGYICECAEGFEGINCDNSEEGPSLTDSPTTNPSTQAPEERPSLTDSTTNTQVTRADNLLTNTHSTVDATSENENSTIVQGDNRQSSVAAGTVAGSLVAVLTIVTALSVLGIVVGIVLWRNRKKRKFAIEECPNKDAMDNPMYCAVDTGFIRRSKIPVDTHGNNSEQPSTNHAPSNGNPLHTPAAFASDENNNTEGLYINQPAAVKQPAHNMTPLTPQKPAALPPLPAPYNTNPLHASVTDGNDSIHTKVECSSQPGVGIQPPTLDSVARNTRLPPPQKPPPLPPSPRSWSAVTASPKMAPYGTYGDETIQRVAINCQVRSLVDSSDYEEPVLEAVLFDNSDYAKSYAPKC